MYCFVCTVLYWLKPEACLAQPVTPTSSAQTLVFNAVVGVTNSLSYQRRQAGQARQSATRRPRILRKRVVVYVLHRDLSFDSKAAVCTLDVAPPPVPVFYFYFFCVQGTQTLTPTPLLPIEYMYVLLLVVLFSLRYTLLTALSSNQWKWYMLHSPDTVTMKYISGSPSLGHPSPVILTDDT